MNSVQCGKCSMNTAVGRWNRRGKQDCIRQGSYTGTLGAIFSERPGRNDGVGARAVVKQQNFTNGG